MKYLIRSVKYFIALCVLYLIIMALSGFAASASLVMRTRPVAEEYTSKQPFLPQVHCGPFRLQAGQKGETNMKSLTKRALCLCLSLILVFGLAAQVRRPKSQPGCGYH